MGSRPRVAVTLSSQLYPFLQRRPPGDGLLRLRSDILKQVTAVEVRHAGGCPRLAVFPSACSDVPKAEAELTLPATAPTSDVECTNPLRGCVRELWIQDQAMEL